MGIKTPFVSEIAPATYAINEFGLSTMYLLEGSERALLIDTGCGVCDLPGMVRRLTDKPLTVALTHGHLDHCGGIGWFDEIYLNERDFAMVRGADWQELKDYVDMFGKAGSYQVYDYKPEDIKGCTAIPCLLPLRERDAFELGDRNVTAYEIPGHTPGGLSFLDEKNRIIFSGDCCNVNLLAPYCSVEETQEGLEKFAALSDRFDQNFNGHVGYMGHPDCLSQPKRVAEDLIYICKMIREGQGKAEPFDFLGRKLTKMHYGCAGLSYDPKRVNRKDASGL